MKTIYKQYGTGMFAGPFISQSQK